MLTCALTFSLTSWLRSVGGEASLVQAIVGRQGIDLSADEPAEPSLVLLLQFRLHPIFPSNGTAAVWTPTVALDDVVKVIRRCPVVRQFFARRNISHRNENDLPLNCNVGVAGMVGVKHAAFSLFFPSRCNEKLF